MRCKARSNDIYYHVWDELKVLLLWGMCRENNRKWPTFLWSGPEITAFLGKVKICRRLTCHQSLQQMMMTGHSGHYSQRCGEKMPGK